VVVVDDFLAFAGGVRMLAEFFSVYQPHVIFPPECLGGLCEMGTRNKPTAFLQNLSDYIGNWMNLRVVRNVIRIMSVESA
jgi:hypothetical protein